jgi:hypothetical protein
MLLLQGRCLYPGLGRSDSEAVLLLDVGHRRLKGGTPGTSDKGWAEGTPIDDGMSGVLLLPDVVGAGTPWDCGGDEGAVEESLVVTGPPAHTGNLPREGGTTVDKYGFDSVLPLIVSTGTSSLEFNSWGSCGCEEGGLSVLLLIAHLPTCQLLVVELVPTTLLYASRTQRRRASSSAGVRGAWSYRRAHPPWHCPLTW